MSALLKEENIQHEMSSLSWKKMFCLSKGYINWK